MTCPNCGYDVSVHEMFSPPRCPVVRIRFDDPPRTFSRVMPVSHCGLPPHPARRSQAESQN